MIRYVLCPGYIRSKTDGDLHYISAGRLAQLYGVRISECIINTQTKLPDGLIYLQPRYHGDYRVRELQ
jgi:hypothetical protein